MVRSARLFLSLGLALLVGCGSERRAEAPPHGRLNLILISIDTLRADHLETYGYARETGPNLARLAATGITFETARSQAPWTLPSLASLHTSLYPTQHGAVRKDGVLAGEFVTIAEALRAAGYHTVGITSHIFANAQHGFAQGFDSFDETQVRGHGAVTSNALTDLAKRALAELAHDASGAPFFLWVHYFDSHFSYVRHRSHDFVGDYDGPLGNRVTAKRLKRMVHGGLVTSADIEHAVALYDGEIAYQDDAIGRLLGSLDGLGLANDTVIVVTADHGEAFMDRGRFFHGRDLYEEMIRVPLVIGGAIPNALRGLRIAAPVETANVPATLMEFAGVAAHGFRGRSLLEAVRTGKAPRFSISEASYARGDGDRQVAVVQGHWKLIHRVDDGGHELYDLASDPGEVHDRFDDSAPGIAAIRAELLAELSRHRDLPGVTAPLLELSDGQEQQLRELGYVE